MFRDAAFCLVTEPLKLPVRDHGSVELRDGARDTGTVCESKAMRHGTLGQTTVLNQQLHQHGARMTLPAAPMRDPPAFSEGAAGHSRMTSVPWGGGGKSSMKSAGPNWLPAPNVSRVTMRMKSISPRKSRVWAAASMLAIS